MRGSSPALRPTSPVDIPLSGVPRVMSTSKRNRRKGLLIATVAVVCVTPDAMLLRWSRELGASAWQIACWKNILVGLFNLGSAIYMSGGLRSLLYGLLAAPATIVFASLLQVGDQLGFAFSFLETNASRAMLLISMDPLWAAVLGWWALDDKLRPRTAGLLLAGLISALLVFAPNVMSATAEGGEGGEDARRMLGAALPTISLSGPQPPTLRGDLIALGTGLCLASYITFVRYTLRHRPDAAIDAAPSLGNFCTAAISLGVLCSGATSDGAALRDMFALTPSFYPVIALNAVLVGAFYVGFTIAPRYLTSAEVAHPPPTDSSGVTDVTATDSSTQPLTHDL